MSEESIATIAKRMIEIKSSLAKDYRKSLPALTPLSMPFWEGASKHELKMQKCKSCGTFFWYPRAWCVECGSRDYEWVATKGKGKLHSFSIVRQVVQNSSGFETDLPYVLGMVDLEEGPRMIAQIFGMKPDEAKIGEKVFVNFVDVNDMMSIPYFKPLK